MSDVARLAGVSAQTVSRVAAGSEHVRPDTRERVLRAMNQLGYSPNRAAQALRRGSFKTIGVLTQQIQRTGEALTTAGVLEAATAADYAVNLVQVEHPASDDLREAVYRLSHQAIDGLVVVQAGRAGREQLVLPPSMPVAVSDSTLVDYYPLGQRRPGRRGAQRRQAPSGAGAPYRPPRVRPRGLPVQPHPQGDLDQDPAGGGTRGSRTGTRRVGGRCGLRGRPSSGRGP